jgi:hypothetical protein
MQAKNRKTIVFAAGIAIVFALAAAGLSQPGRHSVQRLVAAITGTSPLQAPAATTTTAPDVEQRARSHHGWSATVLDAVQRGSVTWYDQTGAMTRSGSFVMYRKFPSLVRVELTAGQSPVAISGFDGTTPWASGQTALTAAAARDIRQWLRCSPERMFLTRAAGAVYREPGRRVEDHRPPTPWQGAVDLAQPREYDQAEMIDLVGSLTPTQGPIDRRRVTYLIDRQTSLVAAARWFEPANPGQSADTLGVGLVETRVDFGAWRDVAGVQWPFEITHWSGGKVDFRVQLTGVQMNQSPADSLFQHP